MREIKFRAWDKELKEMFYPSSISWKNKIMWVCGSHGKNKLEYEIEKPRTELMQFTGLLDKNGKEIYEGDIVIKKGYIWFDEDEPNYCGTVEWIYSQWQIIAHCINPKKQGISDGINEGINDEGIDEGKRSDWEIIGNIYENPELLTP